MVFKMWAETIARYWLRLWSLVLVDMSGQEIGWLMKPSSHIPLLTVRRVAIIAVRVRMMAGLFALLTPLWIIADMLALPPELWHGLAVARLGATLAFACVFISARQCNTMRDAYRSLALLLLVPMSFFLYSYQLMEHYHVQGIQAAFAAGYAFLPFVVLAGLSIFPLTVIECIAFSAPVLLLQLAAAGLNWNILDWPTVAASCWLLILIAGESALAGISQLAFMIVLVREVTHDSMTGCFSRRSGEELLESQCTLAIRVKASLSLAFIDLDHFKQVNDQYDHEAGDQVLVNAADAIRNHLRMGDILVRWGGEEFLLLMPNTNAKQGCVALRRMREKGFGMRPDNTPVTASVGVVEFPGKGIDSWHQLVEMADKRMYAAKQGGRNLVLGCDVNHGEACAICMRLAASA